MSAAPPLTIYGPAELRAAVDFRRLIEPVAEAFAAFSRGEGEAPIYVLHPSSSGDAHVKSAYLRGHPYFVVKIATWFEAKLARGENPGGGFIAVFDAETGDTVALLRDEHHLSDARTAAAGAVAARALAPETVETAGVLGTGMQAYLQVLALADVRPFRALSIWGRDGGRAARLADRVRQALPGVRVMTAVTPRDVVDAADVVITTTASREPLIYGAWLRPGQHITAVGADDAFKVELDGACLRRADRLFVDSRDANLRYGDVARAIARHEISPDAVHGELGELLAGKVPGRQTSADITIVKLVGLGVQDLVAAEVALERLR